MVKMGVFRWSFWGQTLGNSRYFKHNTDHNTTAHATWLKQQRDCFNQVICARVGGGVRGGVLITSMGGVLRAIIARNVAENPASKSKKHPKPQKPTPNPTNHPTTPKTPFPGFRHVWAFRGCCRPVFHPKMAGMTPKSPILGSFRPFSGEKQACSTPGKPRLAGTRRKRCFGCFRGGL